MKQADREERESTRYNPPLCECWLQHPLIGNFKGRRK
jgi:hypothetical protein